MVRDTTEGKTNFLNVLFGPMLERWAAHLTKGRQKYPDPEPGVPNWTLAAGKEELLRAQESALRHMLQWLNGDRDEDHAAAVYFNVNLAEYVRDKMEAEDAARFDAADMVWTAAGNGDMFTVTYTEKQDDACLHPAGTCSICDEDRERGFICS
jgi:hypothetical protein